MTSLRRWSRRYGREVFWGRDARVGYCVAALTSVSCVTSEPVRDAVTDPRVLGSIGAIGLAVVSVSLGAVALMAGLLDETFSYAIARAGESLDKGIDDALQPYRATAVVGATAIGSATTAIVVTMATGNWIISTVAAAVTALCGAWSVAGITSLVFLTAYFAGLKGSVLAHRAETNVVKMQKHSGQSGQLGQGTNAG